MKTYGDDPINPVGIAGYKHKDGGCLTKREHFAVEAMKGILSNQSMTEVFDRLAVETDIPASSRLVTVSIACADALIRGLNEKEATEKSDE